MSENNLLLKLQNTDKGKLVYGRERKPESALTQNRPDWLHCNQVFEVASTKVALEIYEDLALADEEVHNQQQENLHRNNTANAVQHDQEMQDKPPPVVVVGQDVSAILHNLDNYTKTSNENAVQDKTELYHMATIAASKKAEEKYALLRQKNLARNQAKLEIVERFNQDSALSAKNIKEEIAELHKSKAQIRKTKQQEAENRRIVKLQHGKERLKSAEPIVAQCSALYKNMISQMENVSDKEFSSNESVKLLIKNVGTVHISILTVFETCQNKSMMEQTELNDLTNGYTFLLQLSNELVALFENLKLESRKREIERQQRLKIEKEKEEENEKILKAEKEKEISENNPENACPSLPKELRLSVSRSAYHNYLQLKKLLDKYENTSKKFTSDKNNLKLIMGVSKAISVPISSITNRSGSDIKNKLSDLNAILKGQSIKVGNQHVDIQGSDAASYAALFMAKKFVKQAEGQVSSNHSAAFSLALTVLGVWAKNESFGKLVLGQLHCRCPFLVPWYVPKLDGQTEKEYNKLRGYLYDEDDIVEGQDKYLNRMSGLVRSYAAIIQSPLPPGVKTHPHGIAEGWKWVTRMLNVEPWPDVTATVLYDFLDVAGHALMKAYSRQFEKLLYSICHDYFPKIEQVSGKGGGPVQRLQMFLKECIKSKNVPKPEGYLGEDFWNTYHHTGVVGS